MLAVLGPVQALVILIDTSGQFAVLAVAGHVAVPGACGRVVSVAWGHPRRCPRSLEEPWESPVWVRRKGRFGQRRPHGEGIAV